MYVYMYVFTRIRVHPSDYVEIRCCSYLISCETHVTPHQHLLPVLTSNGMGTDEVQVPSTTVLLLSVEVTVITSLVSVSVAPASVLSPSSTISSSELIEWVLELLNSSNVPSGF